MPLYVPGWTGKTIPEEQSGHFENMFWYMLEETLKLTMDFYKDLTDLINEELKKTSPNIDSTNNPDEILRRYINNFNIRRVPERPRSICRSNEFLCPPQVSAGLRNFEEKVKRGDNLSPHLSTSLTKAKQKKREYDGMLYDWNVYHFHLGELLRQDNYIDRTKELLFAFITPSHFYEINIYDHGHWHDDGIIKTVTNNWPDLVDNYRLQGVIELDHCPTEEDRRKLRGANINCFFQAEDGNFYLPPGGGVTTAGGSIRGERRLIDCRKEIKYWEGSLRRVVDQITEELFKKGLHKDDDLEVKLQKDDMGMFYAFLPRFDVRIGF